MTGSTDRPDESEGYDSFGYGDHAASAGAEPTEILDADDPSWMALGSDHDTELEDGLYDDEDYYDDEVTDPIRAAQLVTRRRFLAGLAFSGAGGYGAFQYMGRSSEVLATTPTSTTTPGFGTVRTGNGNALSANGSSRTTLPGAEEEEPLEEPEQIEGLVPAPVDQRILVLIELEGGNDGPSTVVPYSEGAYYDARPRLAIPPDQVLAIDDNIGLNPNLSRVNGYQLAVVEGVGPVNGSLSHFEMAARWQQGDLLGDNSLRTGFLARLADSLDTGQGAVGLSTDGFTPRFANANATTLSLNNFNQLSLLTKDDWIYPAFRQASNSFHGGPMTARMAESWSVLNSLADRLPNNLNDFEENIPMIQESRTLGKQLAMAAELIRADIGTRIVHVRLSGFDTHKGHDYKHERLMKEVDVAVSGFLDLMAESGYSERVLVATSSEFGRRVKENGTGLDHGAASTMLVWGPIRAGRYGEPLSFANLDQRGNLSTTVPFDSYLGSLAQEWLGVEAGAVLPTTPDLLDMVPQI